MAITANNTKLLCSIGNNSYEKIALLMEVPELGGAPEKIDVTTLGDPVKKYIPGIKDYGDLVFKFLYDNSGPEANFRVLKGLDDAGETAKFKLVYPDNTAHVFDAIPSVKIDSGAINGAVTFSATMMLQSDIETVNDGDDSYSGGYSYEENPDEGNEPIED